MIDADLEIVRDLDVLDWPEAAGEPRKWTSSKFTSRLHRLDAMSLKSLFQESNLRRGWLVQTGAVSHFDGEKWRNRDECEVIEPWERVLQAELAFDDRAVRITLLRAETWHCEEIAEGVGDDCLVTVVSHVAVGREEWWRYRVYWALRAVLPGRTDVVCYQPVAWRLLAERQ